MNNNEQQKNTIQNVLDKIENNEITQKSKNYFRIQFISLIGVIVTIVVASIFLASFILFSFKASGHASLIGFGPSGWEVFLLLFPWKLTLLEIGLFVLLEYLLRSFKFGYKIPVLYLLLSIMGLMIISAFVVDQTSLHSTLLREADQRHLPGPVRDLYENTRRPPPFGHDIYRGTVTSVGETSFMIELDNQNGIGTTTLVKVTFLHSRPISQKIGDEVFVRGKIENGEIQAEDIRDAS